MSCALDERDFRRCCRLLLRRSKQLRDGWSWEPVQGSEEGYLRKTAVRSVFLDPEGSGSDSEPRASGPSGPGQQEEEEEVQAADTDRRVIEDEDEDEDEGVCGVSAGSSQVLQYEYHILHSCSYAAPVLYFRAFTQGDPCTHTHTHTHTHTVCWMLMVLLMVGCSEWFDCVLLRCKLGGATSSTTPQTKGGSVRISAKKRQEAPKILPADEGRSLSLEAMWSSVHPNYRLRLQSSPLNTISLQEHPLLGQPFFMLHPCRTEEVMRPVLQAAHEQHRPVNYVLSWLSAVGPVVGLDVPLKYSTLLSPAASPGSSSDTD
uniref:ubiquitin-like-conjugating enzyme ATG10 isoform X3 n=1 Tax=Gasterosteus aculeatus aculeatus TaxID=481459 RepID=UPI001A995DF9|nr:ubiquitin-like-conjugating enzyme ATG10 isoform X3 [Gasterosteus aculeatus aculeatus]